MFAGEEASVAKQIKQPRDSWSFSSETWGILPATTPDKMTPQYCFSRGGKTSQMYSRMESFLKMELRDAHTEIQ